jgi:hypothetical protein
MATMHHRDGLIERPQKVLTVGFDLSSCPPTAISDQCVNGDERISFDA